MTTTCDRCGRQAMGTTMSYFNLETICLDCDRTERTHPLFEKARRAEEEAVRRGDLNFPGIGLPPQLGRQRP